MTLSVPRALLGMFRCTLLKVFRALVSMLCTFLNGFRVLLNLLRGLLHSGCGLFLFGAKNVQKLADPLCELLKQGRHALLDLVAYAINLLRYREIMVRNDVAQVCDGLGDVGICSLQSVGELSGGVLNFLQLREHVLRKCVDASLGISDLSGGERGDTVSRVCSPLTEGKGQSWRICT